MPVSAIVREVGKNRQNQYDREILANLAWISDQKGLMTCSRLLGRAKMEEERYGGREDQSCWGLSSLWRRWWSLAEPGPVAKVNILCHVNMLSISGVFSLIIKMNIMGLMWLVRKLRVLSSKGLGWDVGEQWMELPLYTNWSYLVKLKTNKQPKKK